MLSMVYLGGFQLELLTSLCILTDVVSFIVCRCVVTVDDHSPDHNIFKPWLDMFAQR